MRNVLRGNHHQGKVSRESEPLNAETHCSKLSAKNRKPPRHCFNPVAADISLSEGVSTPWTASRKKSQVGNDQQVAQLDDIQQKAGAPALQPVTPLLARLAGPAWLLWPDGKTRWCQQLHGKNSELTRSARAVTGGKSCQGSRVERVQRFSLAESNACSPLCFRLGGGVVKTTAEWDVRSSTFGPRVAPGPAQLQGRFQGVCYNLVRCCLLADSSSIRLCMHVCAHVYA